MLFTDWNGYRVFTTGVIWNKDWTIKKPKKSKTGYLFSNFYVNGKVVCRTFHSIIAEAFYGPRPVGYEVDHIDNIRDHNELENLRYITKSENNRKSYAVGNRDICGNKNPNSLYRRGLRNGNNND